MANELDEISAPVKAAGREVHVIDKQIPVTVGFGSLLFEISLWSVGFIPGALVLGLDLLPPLEGMAVFGAGILPGIIFIFMKINAGNLLQRLQQRLQANASEIDNYQEQRVMVLKNVVGLLEKSIALDSDIMKSVAALRSGVPADRSDGGRNKAAEHLDSTFSAVRFAVENYPDLKSQAVIADAMRQNSYLQQEITAARTLYNDAVLLWNETIFQWPAYQIVAARRGYTTRIPFIASQEIKEAARSTFF